MLSSAKLAALLGVCSNRILGIDIGFLTKTRAPVGEAPRRVRCGICESLSWISKLCFCLDVNFSLHELPQVTQEVCG